MKKIVSGLIVLLFVFSCSLVEDAAVTVNGVDYSTEELAEAEAVSDDLSQLIEQWKDSELLDEKVNEFLQAQFGEDWKKFRHDREVFSADLNSRGTVIPNFDLPFTDDSYFARCRAYETVLPNNTYVRYHVYIYKNPLTIAYADTICISWGEDLDGIYIAGDRRTGLDRGTMYDPGINSAHNALTSSNYQGIEPFFGEYQYNVHHMYVTSPSYDGPGVFYNFYNVTMNVSCDDSVFGTARIWCKCSNWDSYPYDWK